MAGVDQIRLVESVELLDLYTGPQVGEGHKSRAYRLGLRAPDRTLTADEARQLDSGTAPPLTTNRSIIPVTHGSVSP